MTTTGMTIGSMALVLFAAACERNVSMPPAASRPTMSATAKKFDAIAGQYTGNANIIVNWVQQKQIPISLTINGDGNVSGSVGDAKLTDAQIITRTAMMNRDYRVRAKLSGKLIDAEDVQRDAIDLLFDRSDEGTLVGGFHSSGTKFGGKESMKVSASRMVLKPLDSSDAAAAPKTPAPTAPSTRRPTRG